MECRSGMKLEGQLSGSAVGMENCSHLTWLNWNIQIPSAVAKAYRLKVLPESLKIVNGQ